MYLYNAFGFTLSSPFPIPQLITSTKSEIDITITEDSFSKPDTWNPEELFHANPLKNELIINLKGEPYILVKEGQEITINNNSDASTQEREVLILASGLATILIQKEFLLVHGASVLHKGKVIAFLGPKGIGKSTLTAALLKKGYEVLGDDICAIFKDSDGSLKMLPPPSTLKLTEQTVEKLSISTSEENKHCDLKYWLELPRTSIENLPLTKIYILKAENTTAVRIEPLKGIAALEKILENLYRPTIVNGLQKWKSNFDLSGRLASTLTTAEITRPKNQFNLDALLNKIELEILN
jgi:hypothetical protein